MHFFSIKQINRTFFVKIITLFQRSLSFGNIWVIFVPFVPYYFVSCVRDFMSEKTSLSIVPFPSIPDPFPIRFRSVIGVILDFTWYITVLSLDSLPTKFALAILAILTICHTKSGNPSNSGLPLEISRSMIYKTIMLCGIIR